MKKGIKLEVGKTYIGEVNQVIFKVLREFKDERGNSFLKIKVKGENFEREISANLRLLVKPLKRGLV